MRQLIRRVWHELRRRRVEADLTEEMDLHRAMKQEELARGGMDPAAAASATRRALGSVALAQDQSRDVWVPRWLQGIWQDLRLAVRAICATPVVSIAAIASLSLGIGANTAIFSLLNSLLLRPLPVHDPDRLAIVQGAGSHPVWEQIRSRPELYEGAFAWAPAQVNLARGGEAHLIAGLWASADFFDTLGVPAALGRTFTSADDRRGGGPDGPVAVLSDEFWRRHFGGSSDAIGKPLVLGSVSFTVIGVTPPGFFGPRVGSRFDVVLPLGAEPLLAGANSGLDLRSRNWLDVMIRRRVDQSHDAAVAGLRAVHHQIREATLPELSPALLQRYLREPFDLTPVSTASSPLRARYRQPLIMLMVIVVGVLLIACVNIANLMLARGVARRHEMSVRVALGASRLHVARLMLAEAMVLSGVGALLGFGLARWATPLLVQQLSTRANVVFLDLAPDWRVFVFAMVVTIVTAALFGTVPTWQSTRADPSHALKEQNRGSVGGGARIGSVLVSVQVALSLVLVVAAGLFIRTVAGLATQHVGATRDRVLVVNVTPPMTQYTLPKLVAVYDRVREAVAAVPGVERAALSDITPVGGSSRTTAAEVTGGAALEGDNGIVSVNVVSAGWLATYGMRLLGGREFAETDRINTAPVSMVNEAFARRFLNGANPIGRTVSTGAGRARLSFEIVGLVEDTVYRSLRDPAPPTIFTPTMQRSAARPYVNVSVLAAGGSPLLVSRPIAEAIRQIDPSFVLQFRPLTEQVNEAMTQERVVAWLSGFFGALALLLAGLGLYGVTAYSVSRRRSEIGMRLALGATPMAVVSLIMKRVAVLVCAGTLAGALVSLWASRFVGTLVWGLEPDDPTTLVAAALVLALVAALAGWIPAWRASRIDPVVALRTE